MPETTASASILVTYATRYGSTQEVAEAIAETLRAGGLAVQVTPMRQVRTLEGYRAVVMGAPLYIGHWPKDAQRFLSQHREALMQRPVAVFTLGPTSNPTPEQEWQATRTMFEQELVRYPWLRPVAAELFGGKLDPARLRFPDSLLTLLPASPLYKAPASDARDWDAIRTWTQSIIPRLRG